MLELTTYKNYKELVKALGWEEKKSNNRASQMRQLEAMCKYHKEGQKFIIDEIYEEPKEIVDNRKNNGNDGHSTSKYSEELYPLIKAICYNKLNDSKEPVVYLTVTSILKDYFRSNSMCLEIYNNIITGKDKTRSITKKMAVIDYIQQYKSKVMSRFYTQLKSLSNEAYILCKFNIVRGKLLEKNCYQNLSLEEEKRYISLQKVILNSMTKEKGYKVTLNKLSKLGLKQDFNEKLRGLMREDDLLSKYQYVFKCISITPSDQFEKFALELAEERNLLEGYYEKAETEDLKTMAKDVRKITEKRVNKTNQYNMSKNELSIEEILKQIWVEEKQRRGLWNEETKKLIKDYVLSKDNIKGSEEDRIKHYYYHKEREILPFENVEINEYSTEYKNMIDINYDTIVDRCLEIADELERNEDLANDIDTEDII